MFTRPLLNDKCCLYAGRMRTTLPAYRQHHHRTVQSVYAAAKQHPRYIYIHVAAHRNKFLVNNQPDALIILIFSVIKLYMFRASSLPIIRSFLLYIRH